MPIKPKPNKAQQDGRQARQEGKPRRSPHDPRDQMFPTKSDRRNDDDWKIGYDNEDKSRSKRSKKK